MVQRRLLITGGSGFIGTNLVEYYSRLSDTVLFNLDVNPPKNEEYASLWRQLNLLDAGAVHKAVVEFAPTHVLHMAARTDLDERRDLKGYSVNTDGTANLIAALKHCPSVKRVVFTSSMLVCGIGYDPRTYTDYHITTVYGQSKVAMETMIRQMDSKDFEWVIIRPTSIWGPWFGEPYRNFFDTVLHGRFFKIRGNRSWKTFGFIGNALFQIDRLLFATPDLVDGKTFYIGDRIPSRINDWADEVAECVGKKLHSAPLFAFRLAAFAGDILALAGIKFPITGFRLKNMRSNHTITLLEDTYRVAGDPPYSRKEGTEITLGWMKENRMIK